MSSFFIADVASGYNIFLKRIISTVSDILISDLQDMGIILTGTWYQTLDNSAVRHTLKRHGSIKENLRGQIPVSNEDLMLIPEIIASYEALIIEKNKRDQNIITYIKIVEDCILFYIEEIRPGRRELAATTMYKRKKKGSPTLID